MKYPNCIICFNLIEDDGVRGKRYCNSCAKLKKSHAGKADLIIEDLFLGDALSAQHFNGNKLCVHELVPPYWDGQYAHIPILTTGPISSTDRTGAVVNMQALEKACREIEYLLTEGRPLLVHCYGGVERSPLVIAWWLIKYEKMFSDLKDAYLFLKSKRPIVSDRTSWLA